MRWITMILAWAVADFRTFNATVFLVYLWTPSVSRPYTVDGKVIN
jgi:hypothetical protein